MGVGGFLKSTGKKLVGGVRGVGRVVRGAATGDLKRLKAGLGDIGGAAQIGSFLIPGIGPLAAAGIGALGGALHGGLADNQEHSFGNVLKQGAIGGLAGGGGKIAAGKIGSLLKGGGGAGSAALKNPMAQGVGSKILGGAKKAGGAALRAVAGDAEGGIDWGKLLKGGASLGLAAASLRDQAKQREAAQGFDQGRLDVLKAMLGRAEADYDARSGLRSGGQEALAEALAKRRSAPSFFASQVGGGRKAGQFLEA